jgi:ribokinase
MKKKKNGAKFDVITFGSGLIDIFAFTDVSEQGHFLCYEAGSKIQIEKMKFDIGGGGLNTATTFSRMGLSTGFFTRLGDDELGNKILGAVKDEGIKFLGKADGETGYSIVLDSREHERTILTYKGSNDDAAISGGDMKRLGADWLYFSSSAGRSLKSYKKIIAEKGINVAFNPSAYLIKGEDISEILKSVDVLILNKDEADMINEDNSKILMRGPEIVCVTDGKNPFHCYTNEARYKIYPNKGIKVVERTGAGDAFASGFLAAYIKTGDIARSLKIGVANSESVVQNFGARNKILGWNEALKAVKKMPAKVEISRYGERRK